MALYQGIIGGGSSPVEPVEPMGPVLLWTNSNTASEFGAQTVNLDLTDYVGVIVESLGDAGNDFISSRDYIKKDDTIAGISRYMSIGSRCDINDSASIVRPVTALTNNGITFAAAKQGTTVKNDSVIPYKIYGVKEYVVEDNVGDLILKEFSINIGGTDVGVSTMFSNLYTFEEPQKSTNDAYGSIPRQQEVTVPSNDCYFFALNGSYNDNSSSQGGGNEITTFDLSKGTFEFIGNIKCYLGAYKSCNLFKVNNAKDGIITMKGNSATNGTGWVWAYK